MVFRCWTFRSHHNIGNYYPSQAERRGLSFIVPVRKDSIVGEFADAATTEVTATQYGHF